MVYWKTLVKDMYKKHKSYKQMAEALKELFPDLNEQQLIDKARNFIRTQKEYIEDHQKDVDTSDMNAPYNYTTSIEGKADGTTTFNGVLSLFNSNERITPAMIMNAHNLSDKEWDVVSYRSNFWQTQKKGGKKLLLYQTKIVVKPKQKVIEELTLEAIDKFLSKKQYLKTKLPDIRYEFADDGDTIEITIPDLHIGLLSWKPETGEHYDLKIARQNFFCGINDVVDRCNGKKIKKILFVTLGDILHIDNNHQETTNGTFQQADGRIEKIVDYAETMLTEGIMILSKIAPVEVIYLAGNHDRTVGYMLMRALKNVFIQSNSVVFDISPNPCKARKIGSALVGWCHGDMPKKNNDGWLQNDFRQMFGETKFAEIHSGHLHSNQVIETNNGIIVRYLPKLCSASYWENQQGYRGSKTMVCFQWNDNVGLRDIWFNNILSTPID